MSTILPQTTGQGLSQQYPTSSTNLSSGLLLISVTKHSNEQQLGDKRIYLSDISLIIIHHLGRPRQEFKEGTWKQEQKHRPGRKAAYRLAPLANVQPPFSYNTEQTAHKLHCLHWAGISHNQENTQQTWPPQVSLMVAFSL